MKVDKKPKVLAIVPGLIPSVRLGVVNPLQHLRKQDKIKFEIIFSGSYKSKVLKDVDLVVFCRNTTSVDLFVLHDVVSKGVPYIYEIDDNFFRIPISSELGRFHKSPNRISILKKFLKNASFIRVYNQIMYSECLVFNEKVKSHHLYFDFDLIKGIDKESKEKVRIIYATSRQQDDQQDVFVNALLKIAKLYTDKVEIFFWGAKINNEQLNNMENVKHIAPVYDYSKFIQKFKAMDFDIGLAPIYGDKFFNSKTNNKYREYGACEIAGVFSNEELYANSIVDGVNGLLVNNNELSWFEAIERLVTDDSLRHGIIKNAHADILSNYTYDKFCSEWLHTIHKILRKDDKRTVHIARPPGVVSAIIIFDPNSNEKVIAAYLGFVSACNLGLMGVVVEVVHATTLSGILSFNKRELEQKNIFVFSDDHDVGKYFFNLKYDNVVSNVVFIGRGQDFDGDSLGDRNWLIDVDKNENYFPKNDVYFGLYNDYEDNFYIDLIENIEVVDFYQYSKLPHYIKKIHSFFYSHLFKLAVKYKKYSNFPSIKMRLWMYYEIFKINRF